MNKSQVTEGKVKKGGKIPDIPAAPRPPAPSGSNFIIKPVTPWPPPPEENKGVPMKKGVKLFRFKNEDGLDYQVEVTGDGSVYLMRDSRRFLVIFDGYGIFPAEYPAVPIPSKPLPAGEIEVDNQ